jgi:uncharacterized protein YabE (DUF348 family)
MPPSGRERSLDKSKPPAYAILNDGDSIRLIRVEEEFRTEIRTIPFDRQLLRNESLPEGEERLVQAGVNGQEELTYRAISEDGVQTSEVVIKTVLLQGAVAEIVMIGSRASLSPLHPRRLLYLSAGKCG